MYSDVISAGRFGPALATTVARLARKSRRKTGMPVFLHVAKTGLDRHLFAFSRRRKALHLAIPVAILREDPVTAVHRISAMAKVLARCDIGARGIAECSDGWMCGEGIVSLCPNHPGGLAIPEHEYINTGGYRGILDLLPGSAAFEERRDIVLWRGSTTGLGGAISLPGMTADTHGLLPRTRMCLMLKGVPGCDARIVDVVQTDDILGEVRRLAEAGILGHRVEPQEWLNARYHVAVDGNTLAWSSTFLRLLMGCCVLKPDNPDGYRMWYSDRFEPWVHYVPVAADLSDLIGKIEWCRANVGDAARIAAAGQAMVCAMNVDGEVTEAAARISRAWREGALADEASPAGRLLTGLP